MQNTTGLMGGKLTQYLQTFVLRYHPTEREFQNSFGAWLQRAYYIWKCSHSLLSLFMLIFATRRNCAEVKILQNTNISNSSPSLPTNRPTFLEQSNSAAITVGLPTSTTTTASNNSPSSGKLHDKTIVGYYASWQWVQMVSVLQLIFISKDFVLTNSLSHRSLSFFYRWYDRWVSMQFEAFSLASSDKNAYGCYLIVQLLCSRCNRNKLAEPANMDFRVSMR